jgi:hypothetical protein
MYSMRFPRGNDPNVMRVLKLFRERKCLKKVPHKTIEHYSEGSRDHAKKTCLESPQITR